MRSLIVILDPKDHLTTIYHLREWDNENKCVLESSDINRKTESMDLLQRWVDELISDGWIIEDYVSIDTLEEKELELY